MEVGELMVTLRGYRSEVGYALADRKDDGTSCEGIAIVIHRGGAEDAESGEH